MLSKDKDKLRKERKEAYIKAGADPSSLQQSTTLNTHAELLKDNVLIEVLEKKLGSTYHYFEEEDKRTMGTLNTVFSELSESLSKIETISSYIINDDCSKLDFNYHFGKEFGYFL